MANRRSANNQIKAMQSARCPGRRQKNAFLRFILLDRVPTGAGHCWQKKRWIPGQSKLQGGRSGRNPELAHFLEQRPDLSPAMGAGRARQPQVFEGDSGHSG
jgi:hypothetical protein